MRIQVSILGAAELFRVRILLADLHLVFADFVDSAVQNVYCII